MKPTADGIAKKYNLVRTSQKHHGPGCVIGASGQRVLVEELRAGGFGASDVAKVLKAEFRITVSGATVGRHCRKDCRCWDSER